MGRRKKQLDRLPSSVSSESGDLHRSRNGVRATLAAGGLLAVTGVGLCLGKCQGEESAVDQKENTVWLQPDPVQASDIETFNPHTYQPPKAGRIWRTHFNNASDKTVVYIADLHNQEWRPENWPIQTQIFAIVEDGIRKYGQVPVVLEGWTDFGNPEYNYRRNIEGNFLTGLVSDSDIARRKKAALELMEVSKSGAGASLAAVYQHGVIPIPSHAPEELKKDLLSSMVSSLFAEANHGDVPCSTIGVSQAKMNINTALRSKSPDMDTPERIACMCTYIALYRESVTDLSVSRTEMAATEEVRRGAEHNNPFVYIIAGTGHVPKAMESMEEKGLNYIVVAPQSNNMDAVKKKKSLVSISKVCKQWVADHSEELSKSRQVVESIFAENIERMLSE